MSGNSPTAQYERGYSPGRRRRHPLRITLIVLIVIVGLLIGADFAARAYAEGRVATQIQQQGFPKKPSVTIDGFPFLTQAISRNFGEVQLSSSDVTEGPLLVQSIHATLTNVHVNSSYNGATVSQLTGTMNVTFAALANAMTSEAGGLGSLISGGLNLSAAGSDEVKATLDLLVTHETAVWRITRTGPQTLHAQLTSSGGVLPSSLLNAVNSINIPLPKLPLGLAIQTISVTPSGLVGTITGQNVTFGS
jgi:LmeA-like phospholipid-binding